MWSGIMPILHGIPGCPLLPQLYTILPPSERTMFMPMTSTFSLEDRVPGRHRAEPIGYRNGLTMR